MLGNIVALHLPVLLVFHSLWQPVQGAPRRAGVPPGGDQPMRITFRLQVCSCCLGFAQQSSLNQLDISSMVLNMCKELPDFVCSPGIPRDGTGPCASPSASRCLEPHV